MALVGQSFDDTDRHKALGKVMGLMFLGGATATAVGGALAYFGSWRLVYIIYGVGELLLALLMLRLLEKDVPVVARLNYVSAYREPLGSPSFMRLVLTIFFVGFSVFGTFTYSGKLLQEITGYKVLGIGLALSLFGVGTVLGGRIAPKIRRTAGTPYFIIAGVMGFAALFILSAGKNIFLLAVGLFFSEFRSYFSNPHWSRVPRRRSRKPGERRCRWPPSICLSAEPSAPVSTRRSSVLSGYRISICSPRS
jgi:predicted MFS family arabinose efflux permease